MYGVKHWAFKVACNAAGGVVLSSPRVRLLLHRVQFSTDDEAGYFFKRTSKFLSSRRKLPDCPALSGSCINHFNSAYCLEPWWVYTGLFSRDRPRYPRIAGVLVEFRQIGHDTYRRFCACVCVCVSQFISWVYGTSFVAGGSTYDCIKANMLFFFASCVDSIIYLFRVLHPHTSVYHAHICHTHTQLFAFSFFFS